MKKSIIKAGLLLSSVFVLAACGVGEQNDDVSSDASVETVVKEDVSIDWDEGLSLDEIEEVYQTRLETPHELDTEDAAVRAPDDTNYISLTELEDVEEFFESGTGIIYFGWEQCPYCVVLRQDMDLVLEDLDQQIYMVERNDFTDKENQTIYGAFNVEFVPTLLVYKDGKEVSRMPEYVLGQPSYLGVFGWMADAIINVRGLAPEAEDVEVKDLEAPDTEVDEESVEESVEDEDSVKESDE